MYEELKRVIRRRDVAQNPALVFTIGAASKVLASVLTYPAQVLKTRLQQDAEVTGTTRYQGVKSAIARTMQYVEVRKLCLLLWKTCAHVPRARCCVAAMRAGVGFTKASLRICTEACCLRHLRLLCTSK